jgi:hypothetical protein
MYQVKRYSGRAVDSYRAVFESEDEEKARERFDKLVKEMRQGGVMLLRDEFILEEVRAPNLRTRW